MTTQNNKNMGHRPHFLFYSCWYFLISSSNFFKSTISTVSIFPELFKLIFSFPFTLEYLENKFFANSTSSSLKSVLASKWGPGTSALCI